MGETIFRHFKQRARAAGLAAKGAAFACAALGIAACASDTAPERYSAGTADHAAAAYLPRDMAAARRAVMASLKRDDIPGLVFTASASERAAIGRSADPASAAHEADFAKAGPGDPVAKLQNGPVRAPARSILVQNQMAPKTSGGWRETSDALIHDYSGMRCPKVLDMLLTGDNEEEIQSLSIGLSRITLYDEAGQDTSCDYKSAEAGIYFTLYASNWPNVSREDHFGAALKLMVDRFPLKEEAPVLVANAEVEGTSTIEGETLAAGYITQPIEGVSYKTVLWLNKTGPWHVKARATFPESLIDESAGLSLVEMVSATIHAITLTEVDAHINSAGTVSFQR